MSALLMFLAGQMSKWDLRNTTISCVHAQSLLALGPIVVHSAPTQQTKQVGPQNKKKRKKGGKKRCSLRGGWSVASQLVSNKSKATSLFPPPIPPPVLLPALNNIFGSKSHWRQHADQVEEIECPLITTAGLLFKIGGGHMASWWKRANLSNC